MFIKGVKYIIVAVMAFTFVSCNDFLEEQSNDEVRPSTVDDFNQLMLGEAYLLGSNIFPILDLFADDVTNQYPNEEDAVGQEILRKYQYFYAWDRDMNQFATNEGVTNHNLWADIYKKISACNVVLSLIDNAIGSENEKLNITGQAYALRAFYYLALVNIYGLPYNETTSASDLGVPIITEPQVSDSYPERETVKDVYTQILDDLSRAYPLLKAHGQENIRYRMSYKSVLALYSRIYLYLKDYEKSLQYSNELLTLSPSLQQMVLVGEENDPDMSYNVFTNTSPEVLFAYGSTRVYLQPFTITKSREITVFPPSAELLALYNQVETSKDLREVLFFPKYYFTGTSRLPLYAEKGGRHDDTNGSNSGIRTSEVYLNRVEANIQLAKNGKGGDLKHAMSDLNYLRGHRFASGYTEVKLSNIDDIWEFYVEERRRELAHEAGHRWFDIRRWGLIIEHQTEFVSGQINRLVLDKSFYAMPIPKEVIDRNPAIVQNNYN